MMLKALSVFLFGLIFVSSSGAAVDTMSIQNLPVSDDEDYPVCYDQNSGKLGNCKSHTNVIVNCPADSLQTAVNKLPPTGWVDVDVTGICEENVYITRSFTVIRSLDPANRATIKTQNHGGLNIDSARKVFFRDINISGGASGLAVNNGGLVALERTEIINNGTSGIYLSNNSVVSILSDNVIGPNSTHPAVDAAIGSRVTVWGSNNTFSAANSWTTISLNSNASMGIWGAQNSVAGPFSVRVSSVLDANGTTFTSIPGKRSGVSGNSSVELRDVTHPSDFYLEGGSLAIRGNTSTGKLDIHLNSLVTAEGNTTYAGAEIDQSSHLQSEGDLSADVMIWSGGSAHFPAGDLQSHTVRACGLIAENLLYVNPAVEATGTVIRACPP